METINSTWDRVFTSGLRTKIDSVMKDVGDNITPTKSSVFRAFNLVDFDGMKVVILGQDPYPTPGVADGLAFSSPRGIQRSLVPIYKCLVNTGVIPSYPETGDLSNWARQGVLAINTALTTIPGCRLAHADQWADVMDVVIGEISKQHPGPIYFMLWGGHAKAFRRLIDTDKHVVLTQIHPSPLAQAHISDPARKFINCADFRTINEHLAEQGRDPINWDPAALGVGSSKMEGDNRVGVGVDTEAKNAEAKNAEAKNAEAKNAEAKNAEAKNAEAKNAEAKNAEAKGVRKWRCWYNIQSNDAAGILNRCTVVITYKTEAAGGTSTRVFYGSRCPPSIPVAGMNKLAMEPSDDEVLAWVATQLQELHLDTSGVEFIESNADRMHRKHALIQGDDMELWQLE